MTHRFGVGFEPPSAELFSDGTPCDRRPLRDALSTETCTLERKGRVRYNPTAGDVRDIELRGTWMEKSNQMVADENEKAQGVLYEKRIFGLARQTAAGLAKINVKYEMTSIANIIKDGLVYKRSGIPAGASEARSKEYEQGSSVVDAINIYDMHKVADLLKVTPARPVTFGNTATRR